jgi:classical protein kinase C
MEKTPKTRIGSSTTPGEERELKDNSFYRNINWQKLSDREIQPPFKPKVVSAKRSYHLFHSYHLTLRSFLSLKR